MLRYVEVFDRVPISMLIFLSVFLVATVYTCTRVLLGKEIYLKNLVLIRRVFIVITLIVYTPTAFYYLCYIDTYGGGIVYKYLPVFALSVDLLAILLCKQIRKKLLVSKVKE